MSRYYRAIPHGENGKPDPDAAVGPIFEAKHPDAVHRHLNRKLWTVVPASREDLIASKGKVEVVSEVAGGRPKGANASAKPLSSRSRPSKAPSATESTAATSPRARRSAQKGDAESQDTGKSKQAAQDDDNDASAATPAQPALRSFNRGAAAASVAKGGEAEKPAGTSVEARGRRNRFARAGGPGPGEQIDAGDPPAAPARRTTEVRRYRPPSAAEQAE